MTNEAAKRDAGMDVFLGNVLDGPKKEEVPKRKKG